MALRATPTIAICLTAGLAAGIALARPGDTPAPAPVPAAGADTAETTPASTDVAAGRPDSPYLDDAATGDPVATPPAPAAEDPPPAAITIEGFQFSGAQQLAAGAPVAVTNLDAAPHTLTARNGEFDTGTLGQNGEFAFAAPTAPGTYEFFCVIHPSMTGELVVG